MNKFSNQLDRAIRRLNYWADGMDPGVGRFFAQGIVFPIRSVWHLWRNRKYLSLGKLVNMSLVNLECLWGRERLRGLPYIIKIEPTNICNTTCQLCPTGLGVPGRAKGKMSFESFCKIIDQVRKHTYVADLSNWGDPLIVSDIYKMIRYAHDARIWTYISSNLHAFHPDRGDDEAIVRSGLDMLNCSLHAVSQAAYEQYQPGKNLEVTISKIRAIQDAKRRLESRTPYIQLFFVVTKYNEHEIDAFYDLARSLDCEPMFIPASLNLRLTAPEFHSATKTQWLPKNENWIAPWYRESGNQTAGRTNKRYACDWPWCRTVINWDGAVSVCCGEYNPNSDMGNIFHEPLRVIWNNPVYRSARRTFHTKMIESGGNPCKNCFGVLP